MWIYLFYFIRIQISLIRSPDSEGFVSLHSFCILGLKMMIPLKSFHRRLKWICLNRVNKSTSIWKKMIFSISIVASIINSTVIQTYSSFASATYFVTFISTNLESCLNCLYQLAASWSLVYSLVSMFFLRHKVTDVFAKLTALFNDCTSKN